ncbi:hypothetical protein ACFQI7_17145 [Paenibacillus allorhizosphaerae]|uniref:Uncharacterized protein n=1 Tax=Paenibacillus allorhizosphaerae TaxID=2849866 RepID=A0ABN7TGC9_9BACL|nr:hypothetical protein [Paenibacillus allorhizosphaerae]CAG7631088.1 hypothetical protein PAECIP111802_01708 [Paenibacillus allorhizosphaerae]
MKGKKNLVYMAIALGMILYAVPRIDLSGGLTLPTVFGLAWIAFALLVVAAHLHELLGVEQETKRELVKIKRMKRWQLEQAVQGKRRLLQMKK